MNLNHPRKGFSLIELVVVVSILAILAGAMIPRVTNRMAQSRDARRLADMQVIQHAIDQYKEEKGHYPAANQNASYGGWDVSQDGDFIPDLVKDGYLKSVPKDPINDENYQYRYYLYPAGSASCKGDGAFYVLGVRAFETNDYARKYKGGFKCSSRDWGDEFSYVTGGGATETSNANANPLRR